MFLGRGSSGQPLVGGAADDALDLPPEQSAGFVSRYTFWWTYPSIQAANANSRMLAEHMPMLPTADEPAELFQRCSEIWRSREGDSPQLAWTLFWRTQYWRFLTSLLHGWLFLFLMTIDPLLLNALLKSTPGSGDDHQTVHSESQIIMNLLLVTGLTLSMLVRVSCMEFCYFMSARLANNVRSMLVHSIYRKALVMPDHELDAGMVTNLMATDADKLGRVEWIVFNVAQWSWAIMSLPVVVFFLYRLVGYAAFIATVVIVLGTLVNRKVSMYISVRTRRLQECRDHRAKMMHELVRGIRTVKLQALESLWLERLQRARDDEMHALVTVRIYGALNGLVGSLVSTAIPVSIFASMTLLERRSLDASTAFTALAWISTLRWSLTALPGAYNMIADLKPSMDRISSFLVTPVPTTDRPGSSYVELREILPTVTASFRPRPGAPSWRTQSWLECRSEEAGGAYGPPAAPGELAVEVQRASFGYFRRAGEGQGGGAEDDAGEASSRSTRTPSVVTASEYSEGDGAPARTVVLEDVTLKVPAGQLIMVAGPVGSGKSTLLASLACARPVLEGSCEVLGWRSYVTQKPFLLNGTVKENILFGLTFETTRYEDAIWRAALTEDLRALSLGDQTLVGENGVQLSGGQKARVALARAMYADADVALLDDVLSAVDAHTGRHLWEHCIVKGLKGSGKTVVLVSHQLQYLSMPEVDSVVVLRAGRVEMQGPWEQIRQVTSGSDELLSFVGERDQEAPGQDGGGGGDGRAAEGASCGRGEPERPPGAGPVSVSLAECQAAVARALASVQGRRVDGPLIEVVRQSIGGESEAMEAMRQGGVTLTDMKAYLSVFGSWFTISLLFVLLVAGALFEIASNVWLSIWTNSAAASSQQDEERNLLIYTLISVGGASVGCFQTLILTVCSLAASRKVHSEMLRRLVGAPMSFFDNAPTGRIMNRFFQDMQNIDQAVPQCISDQTLRTLNIITQLSLIYVEAPWVLVSLPFLLVPYVMIFNRMRVPNRDTRRIESAAHSPVYSHFGDTLLGRETVRAFGAEPRFERENLRHITAMANAKYGNNAVSKWAQILTTQWGCALFFVSGFVCVVLAGAGDMKVSQVGLVLLYAGQLQRAAMDYMMNTANLEKQFVSVERVAEYMRLESEEGASASEEAAAMRRQVSAGEPLEGWPHDASVSLQNVMLRYQLHRPLVLTCVDLWVPPGAKVALCGRTGCGKSTLFAALSRLYPLVGGRVSIGGRDISAVPLSELRAQVRVVSQDAFLVSGSLRRNLAMQGEDSVEDGVLWECLGVVGMDEKVKSMDGGLDTWVQEGGQNFSVGERQLLSLARVLVPRGRSLVSTWEPPRILLCDEATASVDLVADQRVHDVLLGLPTTVVMICHRLQHIHRFELVAIMDGGRVVEAGAPGDLLAQAPGAAGGASRLARLCAEAGVAPAG